MSKKENLTLFDFVQEDLFELNSYVTYLFNQFSTKDTEHAEENRLVAIK